MNSRTRETLVALRALRIYADERSIGPKHADAFISIIVRESAADVGDILTLSLERHERQAREEIRRELGCDTWEGATISNETNAKQLDEGLVDDEGTEDEYIQWLDDERPQGRQGMQWASPFSARCAGEADTCPDSGDEYGALNL